jgi:hypothetical protein
MTGEHERQAGDRDYRSYLLRLWRATCDGETVWRASLESPQTGERTGFASLEALFLHLQANTAQTKEGGER